MRKKLRWNQKCSQNSARQLLTISNGATSMLRKSNKTINLKEEGLEFTNFVLLRENEKMEITTKGVDKRSTLSVVVDE